MSLSLWFDLISARWHGKKDAKAPLPEGAPPNPYYEFLARRGHRRAAELQRRFWREDQGNRARWIAAENQQHQAELELPRLQHEADTARQTYDMERARDQEEAQVLNPPGRAYIPPVLYWLLMGLLVAGDAAISYSSFLTIGDVMPWLVAALSLMVVVGMVVLGHVIGDRIRHGTTVRWMVVGLLALVMGISFIMTLFREQARVEAAQATSNAQIDTIIIDEPAPSAPDSGASAGSGTSTGTGNSTGTQPDTGTSAGTTNDTANTTAGSGVVATDDTDAPAATGGGETKFTLEFDPAALPGFLMFFTITSMGIVVPAILAYYVERRPRLLKVVQAYRIAQWKKFHLDAGRRRFYRANRRVTATRAHRVARHAVMGARLDESRDDTYWLMSAYASSNLRWRGLQELPESMRERPAVPGRELLGELDWTYPDAVRGPSYWGKAPGSL